MNPDVLLAIMSVVVIIVLASFARARKTALPPARLDLRAGEPGLVRRPPRDVSPRASSEPGGPAALGPPPRKLVRGANGSRFRPDRERAPADAGADEPTDPGVVDEKSLNAFFMFNGHAFDAYEALGLPAGSSLASARAAFERLAGGAGNDARPFLEEALRTIERRGASA